MESLTVRIATTDSVDTQELAAVAAQTFPLACPPTTSPEDIASFIAANLSASRFAEFLADPQRAVLTARQHGRIVGYAMLIRDVVDRDVPAAELSKLYVLPDFHGAGAATALMDTALTVAVDWGVRRVWLGVNQKNQRAQRFYTKSGFTISGTRMFQLGTHTENDYVMVRGLE
ncbi:GNAT family N-acetyltransferase [Mycobacterium lacus]|uniref:Putative N-acetyltransferase n=1 Tax=Mycobacterium lacus TaxID=169765 RepID=A0A1X1XIF9_9MYCO|nr:GNAT family N-acetyltransferase [Mycobacterium lacus]ORV98604.1 GNAT family acetyltransferase [Mycobacterium lacus]BBX97308.1 putative N-acetyltransferase [Mycobacterium lacus]